MTRSLSPYLTDEDWQAQVMDTLLTHLLKIGALPALCLPGGLPSLTLEMLTPHLPIQGLGSCRRSQSKAHVSLEPWSLQHQRLFTSDPCTCCCFLTREACGALAVHALSVGPWTGHVSSQSLGQISGWTRSSLKSPQAP